MRQADISRFEVFFGDSGSGKTTFLETLPMFFEGLESHAIPKTDELAVAVDEIRAFVEQAGDKRILLYLEKRDNPLESDKEILTFFERLRDFFRDAPARVWVVWPISLRDEAERVHKLAVRIGAESLVGDAVAHYTFSGPPQGEFYSIADSTSAVFNDGKGLADYGIDEELGGGVLVHAPTLGKYFTKLIGLSNSINSVVSDVLSERARPRIWIVVAADDAVEVASTVSALSFGTSRLLDVARFTARAEGVFDSQYMKDWEPLAAYVPFLFRALDVRVIEMSPELALSIARAFGSSEVKGVLRQTSTSRADAVERLKGSLLGHLIRGLEPPPSRQPRRTKTETRQEFLRLQSLAQKKRDGQIHEAIGEAVRDLVSSVAGAEVEVETKDAGTGELRPDIRIRHPDGDPICLEFTWRTTGLLRDDDSGNASVGVSQPSSGSQNTATPGHIQQYVFKKVFEYVKALDLHRLKDFRNSEL
ncbi:hypothetical protein [Paraliomyxa miuraensis]|uniref:hypothetical protein n=1 Tax=Paraliomyxa miuraensis TaxID=376150 RepID=UPI002256E922|nr:hypothetical protein [Paraliomyxa miuraensis]MCX4239495.1 hypothetical protein [Paraliomyxa miuraensis]